MLTAWALELGATPIALGLLAALPLGSQLLQLPAAWLTLRFGARRTAILAVGAARLVWLPMALLPFLDLARATELRLYLAVIAGTAMLGVVGNNAWSSWMSLLVPDTIRGRFFGRRTVYITAVGTGASLAVALLLDRWTPAGRKAAVLSALAAVALVAGAVTVVLLRRQHDPEGHGTRAGLSSQLVASALRDARARPFLTYLVAWNAAVGVAAGFMSFHMLANLETGFVLAAVHGLVTAAARVVAAPVLGRAVDTVGARPVLVVASFGLAAVPVLWLFATPSFLWPLWADAVATGALWCAHGLATTDLSARLAPRAERPVYLALFAAGGGLGFALASLVAGALASWLPRQLVVGGVSWLNLHVLFALSAVARSAAAFAALRIPGAEPFAMVGAARRAISRRWPVGVETATRPST